MAKQLLARLTRPVTLRLSRPAVLGLSAVALAFLATAIAAAIVPTPATCQGVCQCWYCPRYHWTDGTPYCDSPCDHGCAGVRVQRPLPVPRLVLAGARPRWLRAGLRLPG